MTYKILKAEEAARLINNNDSVAFSGFTAAGCPKAVPTAIASRAKVEHDSGRDFKIDVITGASTGDALDGALARENAIKLRTPYQSSKDLRTRLNANDAQYMDYHLSQLPQDLRYGFFGKIDTAIIEACDLTSDGKIILTSGVGIAPTACRLADKIIVELNSYHPKELAGMHDIYEPADPPHRREIPVYKPSDRIGKEYIQVDPAKIIAVVETNLPNEVGGFAAVDDTTLKIGENVANFLASEIKRGIIPAEFLPIQSGVGNIANAVLGCMGSNKDIPPFAMYTEVIQDSVIGLMKSGDCSFASGCSLTISSEMVKEVYSNLSFFKERLLLRPQEISNHPEIARRLGLITINTALELDIFGNVNSTHVMGTKMMNGIGGSGDFTRNGFMSIYTTPSIAKGGDISAIVPMVSHLDHSEHSVKIIITEQGVADLRAKSPIQRANEIIDKCVHPDYKDVLRKYLSLGKGHTPLCLQKAHEFHRQFVETGTMKNVKF
ncbi:MAG: acetyl-CoA hydrolase/transferase family protein [Bacteroidales bacterium]